MLEKTVLVCRGLSKLFHQRGTALWVSALTVSVAIQVPAHGQSTEAVEAMRGATMEEVEGKHELFFGSFPDQLHLIDWGHVAEEEHGL